MKRSWLRVGIDAHNKHEQTHGLLTPQSCLTATQLRGEVACFNNGIHAHLFSYERGSTRLEFWETERVRIGED